MNLLVFSHKECWKSENSPTGWATDGGFSIQMDYLSTLFEYTTIIVPEINRKQNGEVPFNNKKITIAPIKSNLINRKFRKLFVIWWGIKNILYLIKLVQKHDCVHVPIPSDIGTIGIWYALLLNKPLYIRYCGNILNLRTFAEKYWHYLIKKIAGKKVLVLATGGGQEFPIPENKNVKWIFSSTMTIELLNKYKKIRTLDATNPNRIRVGYLGRIEKGKGINLLIDSVLQLNKLFKENLINVEIAGDGNYRELLEQKYKNNNSIKFVGKLNRQEVPVFLHGIDLFIFPSYSEGFPKVVLEAMACGLPIICSNVSILPQLVGDSGSGLILESLSPDNISKAIEKIIYNVNWYNKMSINSINEASKYSIESWVEQIKSHLDVAWKELC